MWHRIVGLLQVHKYHVGGLFHIFSALYDLHNTGHLRDTFLALAKAGLSPQDSAASLTRVLRITHTTFKTVAMSEIPQ